MNYNKKVILSTGVTCQIDKNGRIHVHTTRKIENRPATLSNYICGVVSMALILSTLITIILIG